MSRTIGSTITRELVPRPARCPNRSIACAVNPSRLIAVPSASITPWHR
jgi:hypothetical protein